MKRAGLINVVLVASAVFGHPAARARAEDAGSLNPMKEIDRAALNAFVERPLFDPERRLPPPPPPVVAFTPPPQAAAVEPPPTLRLIGVVHGRRDMAIVHRDGGEKTVILHTGDRLGSWVVTVQPPVGVSLRSGDRTVAFAIFGKGGQTATRAPQAVAFGAFAHRRNPDE